MREHPLTFEHQHRLGVGSLLCVCGAAGRGLVPLEQLVHFTLDVCGAPVAVSLGDGKPLAHGVAGKTSGGSPVGYLDLASVKDDADGHRQRKGTWLACLSTCSCTSAKFSPDYSVLEELRLFVP